MLSQAKGLLSKEWEFFKMTASYFSTEGSRKFLAFITILFAGNINKAHLEGVGLASTLYAIVVLSLSQGYAMVFDTFGSQVYGSPDPGELTTCLMKCLLQGGMLHLILLGPFMNLVYIIDLLPNSGVYSSLDDGQEVDIQDFRNIAVKYLRLMVPVEYLDYAMVVTSTYFIIQGRTKFVYLVSFIMTAVHFLSNYIFVSVLGLGVEGLGLAAITGRFIALIVSLGICVVNIKTGSFPWNGLNITVLTGWIPIMKLGVSGAVFVFVKVLMLEISTFCSQFVSMDTLSTIVILYQIYSVYLSLSAAIAHTCANLMGEALAEGNAANVKQYMILTMMNIILEVVPGSIIGYFWRGSLVRLFTDDSDVIDLFCRVFWLVCVFLICSHLQLGVHQGILTAFGQQGYTAFNMIWSCLLVGIPIVISTIFFTDLGLIGILLGWTITKFILFITGLLKICWTDIDNEIQNSRKRVAKSTYGSLDTGEINAISGEPTNEAESMEGDNLSGTASYSASQEHAPDSNGLLIRKDIAGRRSVDNAEIAREIKFVLFSFLLAATLFFTLAGVSFLREVFK